MGNVILSGIVPPLEKPVGGTLLSDIAVGSIIQLNESGSPVDFYVACHDYGYGDGTDEHRTLLVRKDCHSKRAWHSSAANAYEGSSVDTWLTGTYKALLDGEIQSALAEINIRCVIGNGYYGVETIARDVFLLAMDDYGKTCTYAHGSSLGFGTLPIADVLEIASIDGTAVPHWTRTTGSDGTGVENTNAVYINKISGLTAGTYSVTTAWGIRPAFTLPATAVVSEDGTIIV